MLSLIKRKRLKNLGTKKEKDENETEQTIKNIPFNNPQTIDTFIDGSVKSKAVK